MNPQRVLMIGSAACFAASLLHILIVFAGPDWYRFFGAGEEMAKLVEQGSFYPAVFALIVAALLAACGVYGLSGAGVLPRLPLLNVGLCLIGSVFILRGLTGIPIVMLSDDPYANELEARMLFMVITSLISLLIGLCYLWGFSKIWKTKAV